MPKDYVNLLMIPYLLTTFDKPSAKMCTERNPTNYSFFRYFNFIYNYFFQNRKHHFTAVLLSMQKKSNNVTLSICKVRYNLKSSPHQAKPNENGLSKGESLAKLSDPDGQIYKVVVKITPRNENK